MVSTFGSLAASPLPRVMLLMAAMVHARRASQRNNSKHFVRRSLARALISGRPDNSERDVSGHGYSGRLEIIEKDIGRTALYIDVARGDGSR